MAEYSFFTRSCYAIQRARKDCTKQTCRRYSDYFICSVLALSVLFFFITERSALIVRLLLQLKKVTMQRTHSSRLFCCYEKLTKNQKRHQMPVKCSARVIKKSTKTKLARSRKKNENGPKNRYTPFLYEGLK